MNQKIDRTKSNLKVKDYTKKKKKQDSIIIQRKTKQKQNLKNVDVVFGIDNGSTGTMCCEIIGNNYLDFIQTPSKKQIDYTKQTKYISRLDINIFKQWIKNNIKNAEKFYKRQIKVIVILERPMVNPQRFVQSGHALRAFQATLIVLQELNINYIIIDSKKWQHNYFGKNTTQIDLKFESMKLGIEILNKNTNKKNERKYAEMVECIKKHGDADGLLICKYGTQKLIKG